MGTVFKKAATRTMPPDGKLIVREGQRFVTWKDRAGRSRRAAVIQGKDGTERIQTVSPYYFAKYRDGSGIVRVVRTGCRDETAARQMLADLERQAELTRAGVITSAQASIGRHRQCALSEHLEAYGIQLAAQGVTPKWRKESRRYLERLAECCRFTQLGDLEAEPVIRWLVAREREGMSARLRNAYRETAIAFGAWAVETDRLAVNPFARIPKADVEQDRRHKRRALTTDELMRLFEAARQRPSLDSTCKRNPIVRAAREQLGRERALLWKFLALTGLRKSEAASLTVGAVCFTGECPCVTLKPQDEKNREGTTLPLRADLASDVKALLSEKLEALQRDARRARRPLPTRLPSDERLFRVPAQLHRVFDADLAHAGIPKLDERGRVADVHSLRVTFGTMLAKSGVAPRVAQEAMRHSTIDLTMNVYTDPVLLDVGAAIEALPALPLTPSTGSARATGTDNCHFEEGITRTVAPTVAPTSDLSSTTVSLPVRLTGRGDGRVSKDEIGVSGLPVNAKGLLTTPVISKPSVYPHGDLNSSLLAENQTS